MKKQLVTVAAALTGLTLAVAPTVDAQGKPGADDIVAIASAVNAESGEFSTLLAAATCDYFGGAIAAALTGDDKLTLFAPTDAAFAELGLDGGNVCATFAGDPSALADILTYHVTDGRRFSNSVFNARNSKPVTMLNGGTVVANPDLTLTDENGRTIGVPSLDLVDINASNGVIHVIDAVLLPGA